MKSCGSLNQKSTTTVKISCNNAEYYQQHRTDFVFKIILIVLITNKCIMFYKPYCRSTDSSASRDQIAARYKRTVATQRGKSKHLQELAQSEQKTRNSIMLLVCFRVYQTLSTVQGVVAGSQT